MIGLDRASDYTDVLNKLQAPAEITEIMGERPCCWLKMKSCLLIDGTRPATSQTECLEECR